MKKILFVVHRYAPYPGGSETNVRNMAEGLLGRGYDVTVLAQTNQGDYNNVKVTGNHNVLLDDWDLIIVHGGDVVSQNIAHTNSHNIKSPVLYLIVKPSESDVCLYGLRHHKYLGYGTSFDLELIKKYGMESKARRVRYGLPLDDTIGRYNVQLSSPEPLTIFTSIGGFAPHKRMQELAETFKLAALPNAMLLLFGYDNGDIPSDPEHKIFSYAGKDKETVMSVVARSDALIMNSIEEGFGLVLLEAMMNKTPWIARNIAGAHDMKDYGTVYETQDELMAILRNFDRLNYDVESAYKYVMENHTIDSCVDDIERIMNEYN